MPPKFRAVVRKNLVSLTEQSGGAGLLSSPGRVLFCPSCSTCRKRTLSTATSTTSYQTRSAGFQGATIQYSNRDLSGIGISYNSYNNCTIVPLRRYLNSAVSSDGTAGISNVKSSNNKKNTNIPPHLRELYTALTELEDVAADHVSLSRLQLAQRGLETEEPVIRVAVLGVNDVRATRRLVRLLLADPLTEKQSWEDLIDSYGIEESNGLIIRYGQDTGIVENSLCPTISVTSPVLKNGRLEIFVSTLGAGIEPASVPITEEAFFVPTITVPTSERQHELIRYPVHKTIICGAGTDGLLAYSSLLGRANLNSSEQLVHGVIELNVDGAKTKDKKDNKMVTFVNSDRAEAALDKFRESVHFASEYERGWTGSGVQSVSDWLSLTFAKTGLNPDLQALCQSLLETAEAGVTTEEATRFKQLELTSTSAETRQSLDKSVSVWAERAHTELRNALDEGFASRRWKALSWWKLFWRVDDVGSVMAEILQARYLPRAEKEMIWTAGRVKQTGLLDGAPNAEDPAEETQAKEEEESRHPWPLQIATSRLQMLSSTIPSLQALSQSLVLFSASTTGLTSALSALLYTSASTGLYEACTIAAVGLIYSMRRQQVKWENARFSWETEVRERGRTALAETEELLRTLIRDGPAVGKDESASTQARMIIARASKALEDAKKK